MALQKQFNGLTDSQVGESRKKYGINLITPPRKVPAFILFLRKFKDPLIIILLVAGTLSLLISFYEYCKLGSELAVFLEPVGIFAAILLATGLAFHFENKANKAFSILNTVNNDEPVQVVRNGSAITIPKKDVVVGDVVMLSTGDEVPADGTLLEATLMAVDESSLTGEPLCRKTTLSEEFDTQATYPSNMVLRGTKVMEGHGVFRVTKVGDSTENGKVFVEAQIDNSVKTPLNEQLERLSHLITKISYCFAVAVLMGRAVQIIFLNPVPLENGLAPLFAQILNSLMLAVTLMVVCVPEGLPMAVTLTLAYSMRSMLKSNNLVRKMHACETMGACTVICTDKTGTLTQNRMQVYETQFFNLESQRLTDSPYSTLVTEGIVANTTAELKTDTPTPSVLGNPTEGALLLWLHSQGIEYRQLRQNIERLQEVPFSTERKYMATVVRSSQGHRILYVKGAPEIVYDMCSSTVGDVPREQVMSALHSYQTKAMRTLAFAYQILDEETQVTDIHGVTSHDLTFMGMVAISDPIRQDVPSAIKECMDAGISIKVVTGDTVETARQIAREIGLWTHNDSDANVITGPEFAGLTDQELAERVMDLKIIARARPSDKKRLVETLQQLGQVVSVTGDGTNDAPALNAAHVGLSMGDGTSVAKEASDITIVDNSFSSIGRAVMWGRSLYQNIQRFLLFQLTVNLAAGLLVLVGSFLGTESPITITQMLWVNLIMDTFGAMALASLPPHKKVMEKSPRKRSDFIISRAMYANIISTGTLFFLLMLAALYIFKHADIRSCSDILALFSGSLELDKCSSALSLYEQTLLFSLFIWLNFWNLFNARATGSGTSIFCLKLSSGFQTILLVIAMGQFLIVELLSGFFSVEPLLLNSTHPDAWKDLLFIIAGSSVVLWLREAVNLLSHFARLFRKKK